MTVQNWEEFRKSMVDNDQFKPWFGGLVPMDIDQTLEANGHFMDLEWKNPGGELKMGPQIYFEKLQLTGAHTIFLAYGQLTDGIITSLKKFEIWFPSGNRRTYEGKDATPGKLYAAMGNWYKWAKGTKPFSWWRKFEDALEIEVYRAKNGKVAISINGVVFYLSSKVAWKVGLALRDASMQVDHTARVMVDGKTEETRA